MQKLRLIVPGLLVALLIVPFAAGIARAQCAGSSTSVECTGLDPNGYVAPIEAPGAATIITVQPGAQVNGPILLDGDDTVVVQGGGTIDTTGPSTAIGVLGSGGNNRVTNNGSIAADGPTALGAAVVGPDSQVTNNGSIAASGDDIALGMGGLGQQAAASNNGTITADAVGIALGMGAAGPGAAADNSGTVTASGGTAGLGVIAAGQGATATNSGTVAASGDAVGLGVAAIGQGGVVASNSGTVTASGDLIAAGVVAAGPGATASNSGTVTANGGMAGLGVAAVGQGAVASNSGTITASGEAIGMGMGIAGYHVQATNNGAITATGEDIAMGMAALAGGGQLNNNGAITVNSASGYWASGVYIIGNAIQVNNTGTIDASGAGGVGVDIEYGSTQVNNSGTITGGEAAIWGNDSTQIVVNSGTLNGEVWLEGGNDVFSAAGGEANGLLDGGDDYDILSFEMEISAESWESAVEALSQQLDPNGGTIVLGGVTYTWANFEELRNLIQLYAIRDRRINGLDIAATAIVYRLEAGGVELYTPQGDWAFNVDAAAIRAALTQAAANGAPVEVGSGLGLALYALPDGSLFVTGPGYAFSFQPYHCGIDL